MRKRLIWVKRKERCWLQFKNYHVIKKAERRLILRINIKFDRWFKKVYKFKLLSKVIETLRGMAASHRFVTRIITTYWSSEAYRDRYADVDFEKLRQGYVHWNLRLACHNENSNSGQEPKEHWKKVVFQTEKPTHSLSVAAKAQITEIFATTIGVEAAGNLMHMAGQFDQSNNSKFSKDKGSGSMEIEEVAHFVKNYTTGREKTFLGHDDFMERLAPVVKKWDLDGNGTMELHEMCIMMLCDENFSVEMDEEAKRELLQLLNAEMPQMIQGKLQSGHEDKGDAAKNKVFNKKNRKANMKRMGGR